MPSLYRKVLVLVLAPLFSTVALAVEPARGFFDYDVKSIDGQDVHLKDYKGHLVMVVNVASKCGYTPQYKGLEALYEKYKDRGFVILGFPSNDFMGQEPGTAEEIKKFCKLNYGVTFPLMQKNPVKGDAKQPIYKYLTEHAPKGQEGEVGWNFEKFLIASDGQILKRWKSKVTPESQEITDAVADTLAKSVSPQK